MRVQCDVCGKEEASVFCCADEAALCGTCDTRVHTANKLAGKHRRFSLLHPTSDAHVSRCDVCQERKALLFCQEDRAILCADCDGPIHSANEFTMKHTRFLLAGVKLSPTATPSSSGVVEEITRTEKKKKKKKKKVGCKSTDLVPNGVGDRKNKVPGSDGSDDFCDYLMNTLPGWKVDDFLLDTPSSSCSSPAFPVPTAGAESGKMGFDGGKEEDLVFVPFVDQEFRLDSNRFNSFEAPILWIPQVPQLPPQATATNVNIHRSGAGVELPTWGGYDEFSTVPQITIFQSLPSKKRSTN